jgi:DNA-directed RNA polymerase specialized sigma24 family protein
MRKRDFTRNRSDQYQHLLQETSTSPDVLTEFSDSRGMHALLNGASYSECLIELKEKLRVALWRLIDSKLTDRQKEVIYLHCDGYTQTEIAKKLGVNQSSITKSINGNCDYNYKSGKRVYGGAKKKLRKLSLQDSEIQEILRQIGDLQI